jgi:hypothetical protein
LVHGCIVEVVCPFFCKAFLHLRKREKNPGLSRNEGKLVGVGPEALVQRSGECPILRFVPVERSRVRYLVSDEGGGGSWRQLVGGWGWWSVGGAHVLGRIGGVVEER